MNGRAAKLRLAFEAMEGIEAQLSLSLTEDAALLPITAASRLRRYAQEHGLLAKRLEP